MKSVNSNEIQTKFQQNNEIVKGTENDNQIETVRDIFSQNIYKPMKHNAKKAILQTKHELTCKNGNTIQFRLFFDKDLGFSKEVQKVLIAKDCDDDLDSDQDVIARGLNETIEDFKIALKLNRDKMDCLSQSTEDSNN